jgi:protein-S-isoprenylcysteine O-methyltransferase Ste14
VTAAVGITALAQFNRHETTFDPETPELASALVTDGIYGYTRNPMYLALTGALVTHAVWLGSLRAIPPVAALAVVLTAFQIRPEERALEQIFGDEYRDYMNQVPRWLGWPSEGKTPPGV